MKKKLIISIIIISVLSLGIYLFSKDKKQKLGGISIDSTISADLNWKVPTTDLQWAEDVKAENFDIKSTGVLQEMIVAHTSKLEEEQKDFQKYVEMKNAGDDPVKFLYWQKRDELKQRFPTMVDPELQNDAQKAAQTEYNQKLWEINKIEQSLDRMSKEIELRQKGFVVVEGDPVLLGGKGAKIIRQIHD